MLCNQSEQQACSTPKVHTCFGVYIGHTQHGDSFSLVWGKLADWVWSLEVRRIIDPDVACKVHDGFILCAELLGSTKTTSIDNIAGTVVLSPDQYSLP